MEEKESYLLITRYLSKQTSTEENGILADWLAASDANERTFEEIKAVWLATGRTETTAARAQLTRLKHKINRETPVRHLPKRRVRYWLAASITGLLLTLSITFYLGKMPIKNNYRQYATRSGERKMITLADGSIITLGPLSKLRYPENFEQATRFVDLDGEAYFEVSKDPHRPFIVRSGMLNVQVLGTHFNVNADKKQHVNSVALLEGSVKVWLQHDVDDHYFLKPGQQLDFDKDKQQVFRHPLDSVAALGWMKNILNFNNEKLGDVAPKIEKMYGVKLVFADQKTADTHLYARFENEPLQRILDHIAATGVLSYELQDNKIYITSNSHKKK